MLIKDDWNLRQISNEDLREIYDKTCEEFINYYSDRIEIDLTDKVVVAVSYSDNELTPIEVLSVLIPEQEKHGYKATLIYSGHIAFVKLEYNDGRIKYLIKDDECPPQSFDDCIENGDILYCAEENGYTRNDILKYIENFIRVHNFKFNIDKEKLIMLEGL